MFGYLTAKLPKQFGYAKKVAERLIAKGLKSIMGLDYTNNVVYQVVDKGYPDIHVERELVALNEEYFGLPISQICPDYVPSL
ncbi:hypothetical protein [Spirosoma sp. KUDC1026]|uniref:hypothetical protein n=1 Tax=Spirosoma sp. KUDC1026 TaxID=2745947 RepID=UPI00159BC446|nr:hypothetical protein [Spirosoma sp. KUDC1026]QKZ15146.1 hypothetical protein HU175_21995 [Spirosoma sp. KUDC1026]